MLSRLFTVLGGLLMLALLPACGGDSRGDRASAADAGALELRIGHFPNLTHVQALVARHMSRGEQGGWYERRVAELLGRPVRITWQAYNAGPSIIEAVFARSLDVAYVGPSPVINAWVKARGGEVRILAGAVQGGSALVVPQSSAASSPDDFRGQTLATPQLGNTQDVSCRAWLAAGGLRITLTGGDARIMPTRNAEQLSLFAAGRFAGVWTVEPWVSRLEQEAGGKILLEDPDALTTVLAVSESFLRAQSEAAAAVATAHRELTRWIIEHPAEAQSMVISELRALTRTHFDPALVASAWRRIRPVAELSPDQLQRFARQAYESGFLPQEPQVAGLIISPSLQ